MIYTLHGYAKKMHTLRIVHRESVLKKKKRKREDKTLTDIFVLKGFSPVKTGMNMNRDFVTEVKIK